MLNFTNLFEGFVSCPFGQPIDLEPAQLNRLSVCQESVEPFVYALQCEGLAQDFVYCGEGEGLANNNFYYLLFPFFSYVPVYPGIIITLRQEIFPVLLLR